MAFQEWAAELLQVSPFFLLVAVLVLLTIFPFIYLAAAEAYRHMHVITRYFKAFGLTITRGLFTSPFSDLPAVEVPDGERMPLRRPTWW